MALVRQGIGHESRVLSQEIDWTAIKALADAHGLSAIVLDGIERLQDNQRPPQVFLLEWIGEVLQEYEYRYDQYRKAISELAGFYNRNGYKMMVLKGYACSIDWPKPEHRPCGDIDIWLFGKQKEADATLEAEKPVQAVLCKQSDQGRAQGGQEFKVDRSHHHHTVFYWNDFMVENHYDFINVHHHRSNAEFELILKELARNDTYKVDIYGEKVCFASANLHALFLVKHMQMHFGGEEISIRQLLDWAFFVEKHGKDVDWKWLMNVMEKFGMMHAFSIFNRVCVENLAFSESLFPKVLYSPVLKEKVLKDILNPEYGSELPDELFPRIVFKFRRWRGNAWKHKLCYKESMWSAFWSGVWNHLLKPSSI